MNPIKRNRLNDLLAALVLIAFFAWAGWVLYHFNRETYTWYPRCPLYLHTGILCPLCGSTRSMHHLLHGDWRAALDYNALAVVGLPILAGLWLIRAYFRRVRRPYPVVLRSSTLFWATLAVMTAFTILRNIPLWPFSWLAP